MPSKEEAQSYCDLPFEHQYVHMSGSIRLCCATLQNVDSQGRTMHMSTDSLESAWNSDYMKKSRLAMKNGKVLDACSKCVQQEERGYGSMRVTVNKEKNLSNLADNGSINFPNTMELHFGNMCNLKCKMCGQDYSNQVGKEILEIGEKDQDFLQWVRQQSGNVNNWTNDLSVEYTWFKDHNVKKQLIDYVSRHIKTLTVIGGEPTIINEFYDLLDHCDQQGTLGDKTVTIVTNLTNTNKKMTQWLPKMKNWTIWASIDGIGETTEYIRYPSNFKKVIANLKYYKDLLNTHGNGKIVFSPAVQLLNIHQLDDMLKMFINFSEGEWQDRTKYDVSWLSQVWYPRICNYDVAPKEYRSAVANKLRESVDYFDQHSNIKFFYRKQIENLNTDFLDKTTEKNLQRAFIRYNDTQDRHRQGKTWRELLPDLESALTKSLS